MCDKLTFTVPLIPPSANHYKARFRNGRTVVSKEALAFKAAVKVFAQGRYVTARTFSVSTSIVLGKKERLDVDNGQKMIFDGLADCGVFRNRKGERVSDAYVRMLVASLDCDSRPDRGLTEITVEALT